jgi:hypothetical protein
MVSERPFSSGLRSPCRVGLQLVDVSLEVHDLIGTVGNLAKSEVKRGIDDVPDALDEPTERDRLTRPEIEDAAQARLGYGCERGGGVIDIEVVPALLARGQGRADAPVSSAVLSPWPRMVMGRMI